MLKARSAIRFFLFAILTVAFVLIPSSYSEASNSGITYHGRILKADGTPLEGKAIQFQMQVRSPGNENCLMYQEVQTLNMSGSSGVFSITINDGTGSRNDSTGITFGNVFSNRSTFSFPAGSCAFGSAYTPNISDGRAFVVGFRDENMASYEVLPTQAVNFAPMAIQALAISGFGPTNLLRVDDAVTSANATPLNLSQFNAIMAVANGTAPYVSSSATGGALLPVVTSAPTTPASGSIWFNSSTGNLQYYNGSSAQTVGTSSATGTVTSISTGTGLTGGPITTSGTIALAPFGTAGTYFKVITDATGRVSSGSTALAESDLPNIVTAGKVSGAAITSGTIAGTTAINTSGNITGGNVSASSLSGQSLLLYNTGNTHKITVTAPPALATDYSLVFPATAGTSGYVLSTDGAGNLSWVAGSGAPTGTAGGDLSGTYPNPTVSKLNGTSLSTSSLTTGNYLRYNGTNWVNAAIPAGDLPTLATGYTGILPIANGGTGTSTGSITGSGALTFTAGGTNQNVTLSPSGTGNTLLNGNVGIGTTSPSVALDLGAKTDALRLPNGATAQEPAASLPGMIRYNTSTPGVEFYNGSAWVTLSTGGAGAYLSSSGGTLSGALTVSAGGISVTGGENENGGSLTNVGGISGTGSLNLTPTSTVISGSGNSSSVVNTTYTPASAPASGTQITGLMSKLSTSGAADFSNASAFASTNQAVHNTTATIGTLYGAYDNAINYNTGTVTSAYATSANVTNNSTGTIGTATGVSGVVTNVVAGGSITKAYGLYSKINQTAGTIGTGYGLYLDTIGATTKYGVYQTDSTANNYFAGNVGIGTTSPAQLLSVVAPTSVTAGIHDIGTIGDGTNGLAFGWTGNGSAITNSYVRSTNGLPLRLATTTSISNGGGLTVLDSGLVGVGTTNPGNLLSVYTTGANGITISGTGSPAMTVTNSSGAGYLAVAGTNASWLNDSLAGDVLVRTNTGTNFRIGTNGGGNSTLTVSSGGNVGIGSSSPATKLDVAGTVTATGFSGPFTSSGYTQSTGNFAMSGTGTFSTGTGTVSLNGPTTLAANQSFVMPSGTGQFTQNYSGAGPAQSITDTGSGDLFDLTSTSTTAANNDKAVNVNISGANGTAGVTRYGVYSTVTSTGATSTNVAGYFSASGGTNNYGLLVPSGSVGIGTSSPPNILTVSTAANIDGFALQGNQTVGNTVTTKLATNLTAGAWNSITQAGDSGIFYFGTNTTNAKGFVIAPWNASTSGIRMDGTGNVGIGVSSPSGTLQVAGGTAATDTSGTSITLTAQNGGTLSANPGSNGGSINLTPGAAVGTGAAGSVVVTPQTQGVGLVIKPQGAGTATLTLGTNDSMSGWNSLAQTGDNLFLFRGSAADSSTSGGFVLGPWSNSSRGLRMDYQGNVGIGSSSPASKLDVAGTITATGFSGPFTSSGYTQSTGNFAMSGTGTFSTGTGAVSLNGPTTVAANQNFVMASGTGQFTHSYSGAGPAQTITDTGSGDLFDLTSTSTTAVTGDKAVNVGVSGANGTSGVTRYGVYSTVTSTGATSTNVAGYFSASGGTTNYGLLVPSGNVGFGTSSPSVGVDIESGALKVNNGISGAGQTATLYLADTTITKTYGSPLAFAGGFTAGGAVSITASSGASILTVGNSSSGPAATFNGGSGPSAIFSNGSVGIGTTSPANPLQVNGTGEFGSASGPWNNLFLGTGSGASALNYATSYVGYNANRSSGNWTLNSDGAHNGGVMTWADISGNFWLSTATSSGTPTVSQTLTDAQVSANARMVVTQFGNVGIGTTSPGKKLEISQSVTPASGVDAALNTRLFNTDTTGTLAAPGITGIGFGNTSTRQAIVGGTFGNDFLDFYTSGALSAPRVRIDSNGNVGIGTTSPAYPLSVYGAGTTASTEYLLGSWGNSAAVAVGYVENSGSTGVQEGRVRTTGNVPLALGTSNYPQDIYILNTNGNVGIRNPNAPYSLTVNNVGTTASTEYLVSAYVESVSGIGVATGYLENGAGSSVQEGRVRSIGNVPLALGTSVYQQAISILNSNGNVGIGTTSPSAPLSVSTTNVSGNIASFVSTGSGGAGCSIAWNGTSCSSDARLKENVVATDSSLMLDSLLKARPVHFTWIKDPEHEKQTGFIAQEFAKLFPEFVKTDANGYLQVNYAHFVSVLTSGLQEFHAKWAQDSASLHNEKADKVDVAAIQAENSALKAKVEQQDAKLQQQEKDLAAIKKKLGL